MKDYFKKFSIMFILLLAIMGIGAIQNGIVAKAATIGQQLTQPESGWKRYDDTDSNISYEGSGWKIFNSTTQCYGGSEHGIYQSANNKIKFNFTGNKIRLIGQQYTDRCNIISVKIDNAVSTFSQIGGTQTGVSGVINFSLDYEKTDLLNEEHSIEITIPNKVYILDAIDLDYSGKIKPFNENISSISLNKSTDSLQVGQIDDLIATTTPAGIQVNWSSSDESVATVDSTGKVIGVKEGTCTITATTADGLTATCTVTVTPKTSEPTEPQDPTGDGTLFIELVDGNIKSYDVSSQEITSFINWYKNRDLDDSQSPVYKFKKGDYTDYVVHDKIDWFEVR
ncbi:Ig-like domain-containing protein [Clostridium beijerinckii]|uniref:Ig-like domain-containing protein n=1 Tax=Clostridium beijerinckii TaxID=1520 RepID=UPI002227BCDF|nr:Ig-like domain-containing protein [Clostridium beijerinckii]UYZ36808.1 Ig-like domain-containing protein [Clostridium beijerinckii]